MRKSLLLSCLLTMLVWASAKAQDRQVTGRVTSADDGSALPGVSIQVKGTTRGTQSDANGNYALSVPAANSSLIFSFIGTTTQEVQIGNRSTIDVKLVNDTRALSEVVVVGYGTQQRRDLTGSQLTVRGDEIAKLPVQTFETALQGRTPGVQITQGSGKLGSALQIRVRGAASISAGNEPLYVLDGIPITSQDANTTDTELFSPLADIDPNDIESIEILKRCLGISYLRFAREQRGRADHDQTGESRSYQHSDWLLHRDHERNPPARIFERCGIQRAVYGITHQRRYRS